MRWLLPVLCLAPVAAAQDRFVERTPYPKTPQAHTLARAGNPHTVAWWAVPSVVRTEAGGYVGGGSLRGNAVLTRGLTAAPGPVADGTFGWDYVGPRARPGRVFLAASPDPSAGPAFARNYRAEGPHVPDVFALRPFRRAVLEKKEAVGEHRVGGH